MDKKIKLDEVLIGKKMEPRYSITGVTLFYTHWQLVLTEKMWLILMRSI